MVVPLSLTLSLLTLGACGGQPDDDPRWWGEASHVAATYVRWSQSPTGAIDNATLRRWRSAGYGYCLEQWEFALPDQWASMSKSPEEAAARIKPRCLAATARPPNQAFKSDGIRLAYYDWSRAGWLLTETYSSSLPDIVPEFMPLLGVLPVLGYMPAAQRRAELSIRKTEQGLRVTAKQSPAGGLLFDYRVSAHGDIVSCRWQGWSAGENDATVLSATSSEVRLVNRNRRTASLRIGALFEAENVAPGMVLGINKLLVVDASPPAEDVDYRIHIPPTSAAVVRVYDETFATALASLGLGVAAVALGRRRALARSQEGYA